MAALTQEDLTRFFEQHLKPCHVCGANDWQTTEVDQPVINALLGKDGKYNVPPLAILSYPIICQGCGYVRHHESKFIVNWVRANPND